MGLIEQLHALRPQFAEVAQKEYDQWKQDSEGYDEEVGYGGICDCITNAIIGLLATEGIDAINGGQDGDDHAYAIAYNQFCAFVVDIPYATYEFGGGYQWTKKPGVVFTTSDVCIYLTCKPDHEEWSVPHPCAYYH